MPGPGEYRPDATEGITRIEDLPRPNVGIRSRDYRRRPCPRCGHGAYRDSRGRRTLHDLGDPLTGRPRDLVVLHSRHYCSKCRRYFVSFRPACKYVVFSGPGEAVGEWMS